MTPPPLRTTGILPRGGIDVCPGFAFAPSPKDREVHRGAVSARGPRDSKTGRKRGGPCKHTQSFSRRRALDLVDSAHLGFATAGRSPWSARGAGKCAGPPDAYRRRRSRKKGDSSPPPALRTRLVYAKRWTRYSVLHIGEDSQPRSPQEEKVGCDPLSASISPGRAGRAAGMPRR